MIAATALERYLKDFLNCSDYTDYAPNGLQVAGTDSIHHLCTAVTASREVINKTAELGGQALLVHHGYFWRGEDPCIVGNKYQRIAGLFHNNINLFAYHLPLDCHRELGNNQGLAKALGITITDRISMGNNANLLWIGQLDQPVTVTAWTSIIHQALEREPLVVNAGNHSIQKLAWCTGSAQDFIEKAAEFEVDAYLSGEISERTFYQAKELGVHYFACGHHATERFGVKALGEHLSQKFGIQYTFIDTENPV